MYLINADGRHYDYVVGPRLGRTNSKEQYVYIFDSETIEIDRQALYTVADPGDRLHREPLVGWFRKFGAIRSKFAVHDSSERQRV